MPSSTSKTSPLNTPLPKEKSTAKEGNNVAYIVGGVCGGCVVVIVVFVFIIRRKVTYKIMKTTENTDIDETGDYFEIKWEEEEEAVETPQGFTNIQPSNENIYSTSEF
ncbi:uncharacterized protein [Antedon mediterranea]|uniref:uncharacterized protein n=1 Tax=Antedon mediterranea TaxID=105859 RepID=UPI003AF8723B